jgi:outer membrane protein assembly factor BamA
MNAPRLLLAILFSLPLAAAPGLTHRPVPRTTPASSQASDSEKILIAIDVKGVKRFSPEAVIAASGLRIGATVSDDDFKKAARRLGDTGAFSDIVYSYSYSSAGTKLDLQLTEAEKFFPALFEDFVWFTDSELQAGIKERVPLFNGELPLSGRLPDEVSDALQGMLVQKGASGHVNYVRATAPDGEINSYHYSIENALILIRDIHFSGAPAGELPALEAAVRKLPERSYARTRFTAFIARDLLPVFHAHGYLKASFAPPQPTVVPPSADSTENRQVTLVDVTVSVTPGPQYKVSLLEWSGNHEFSTETLMKMVRCRPGDPANTVQLGDNLSDVRTLYGSRGYIRASIKVDADFDDAANTVALRLLVNEDAVYHMGELEFRGLDNSLTARLRAAWKLRPGDVYDATYLKPYLAQADKLLPANFDWGVEPHVTANVRDKIVDVDLQYTMKAPR